MPQSPPPPPPPMSPPPMGHQSPASPGPLGNCPSCGTEIKFCSHCGAPLDQHGVVGVPTAPRPSPGPASAPLHDVVLLDPGEKKVQVIKAVRGLTGAGLREAKDLVDAAHGRPTVVVTGVSQDEANTMAARLTAA